MALVRSRDYPVGASNGYLFDVAAGYGKFSVVTGTTHLTSKNIHCWIDGDDVVLSRSREYSI